MKWLIAYLRRPFSSQVSFWKSSGGVLLAVIFILGVFQPFGISTLAAPDVCIVVVLAAVASLLGLFITLFLFPRIFKRYYTRWTVGKNILSTVLTVFVVGLANGLVPLLFEWMAMGNIAPYWGSRFLYLFGAVIAVSPFPVAVTAFLEQNQSLKRHLEEVQEMNRNLCNHLAAAEPPVSDTPLLSLAGTTRDSVEVRPEELLYLEACGNYVKVNYSQGGQVRQKMLRTTLKQMEETLSPYPYLVRCHRAFLVNLDRVQEAKGNSQGYRLGFRETSDEVPVSRAYTAAVREHILSLL